MRRRITKTALGMLLLASTNLQTQASSDLNSCQWGAPNCSLSGTPYLDVNNDTRDNLLRIIGAQKHFPLPLYRWPKDDKVSRNGFFGFHIDEALQTTSATDDNPASAADTKALSTAMRRAGVTTPVPEWEDDAVAGRTVSNNPDSAARFINALNEDATLDPTRRQSLAAARVTLLALGGEIPAHRSVLKAGVTLPGAAGEFRAYLGAAEAFYRGDYTAAAQEFDALRHASQTWVAQTAHYMMMRVWLNQSTASATDQYGLFELNRIDTAAAGQALSAAKAYLARYPDGLYAQATEGTLRRIYWYLGRPDLQAPLYKPALEDARTLAALEALVEESDIKLLSPNLPGSKAYVPVKGAPLLNFIQGLRSLRDAGQREAGSPVQPSSELPEALLASQNYPGLAQYLHDARLFWRDSDYRGVINGIRPDYRPEANSLVGFSRQILYGAAQMALRQWPAAEGHWRRLLAMTGNDERGALIQMKLAATLVASRQLPVLLAADSPITNLRLRSLVLKTKATRGQLREQVLSGRNPEERTIALHTLLMRDLLDGAYGEWLRDMPLRDQTGGKIDAREFEDVSLTTFDWQGEEAKSGYACPGLAEVVGTLAKNSRVPWALNCLGEFSRLTGVAIDLTAESGGNDALDTVLAGSPTRIVPDRQSFYRQIIADPKASTRDKSFALFRAVRCYAPSGYNDCGGKAVGKAVRRQWFNQLKQRYPDSPWAARLKYYW